MADVWIPLRIHLIDDPAVIAIAATLDMDDYAVVGRLHRIWGWANENLENGNAPGVTEKWIDRYINCVGFANAMILVGWLIKSEVGITFPNYDVYNSKCAKRRILTAKRVAKSRQKSNAECNAPSVTPALPEKRREEINTPLPPKGGKKLKPVPLWSQELSPIPANLDKPDFNAEWLRWLAFRADEKRKPVTLTAGKEQLAMLSRYSIPQAIEIIKASIRGGYQGLFEPKSTGKTETANTSWYDPMPPERKP